MPKPPFALSRKTLAWICVLGLIASLLPLYLIAFDNRPFYDDFGFSLLTRAAWQSTGSFAAVVAAAVQNTLGIRHTWEGTYTTSFISAMQPGIWGENCYWVATFLLLSFLLLSLWYFLRQVFTGLLRVDAATFTILFSCLAFCMVQFVPDPSEAFFWFNGGVAYALLWSLMLLTMGVWLRFTHCAGKKQRILFFALLLLLVPAVGGGKYSTVLFACLCAFLFTLWAFCRKHPLKWLHLALTLLLTFCLGVSILAPGNAVRSATLPAPMAPHKAIAQAFFFGLTLIAQWFSLPLVATLVLSVLLLIPFLRQSPYAFKHPAWVTALAFALFCAQLTPTLYTGNFLGDGRTLNTYFFTHVLMSLGLVLYWTGWGIRRMEAAEKPLPAFLPKNTTSPLRGKWLLALVLVLFAGCIGFRPDGAQSFGPQNMAGGSAAISLLRGESRTYRLEMAKREALLNDPAIPDVTLTPISTIPRIFMSDAITGGSSLTYVTALYAQYYQKESVTAALTGE